MSIYNYPIIFAHVWDYFIKKDYAFFDFIIILVYSNSIMNWTFSTFSRDQKRELCLTILWSAKEKWWIFLELYNLILLGEVSDIEYENIYTAAMTVLEEQNEAHIDQSLEILENTKRHLIEQRKKEMDQNVKEQSAADLLLHSIY